MIVQKSLSMFRIQMKTKKIVANIKDRISDLKDRIREMVEKEKK